MICPACGIDQDKVIDSRASEAGRAIRRRRECLACGRRFTTYERVEQMHRLVVIKRDGTRVAFSREKVLGGILAACGKRPIAQDAKDRLADEIDDELHREFDREVEAKVIGERVMLKLRDLDEVAALRFASEHLQIRNIRELIEQAQELDGRVRDVKDQQALFADESESRPSGSGLGTGAAARPADRSTVAEAPNAANPKRGSAKP